MRFASRQALWEARQIVQRGDVGRVVFCRVKHAGLMAAARDVLDQGTCGGAIEVDADAEGVAFLGERGTLVVDRRGCKLFECKSQKRTASEVS